MFDRLGETTAGANGEWQRGQQQRQCGHRQTALWLLVNCREGIDLRETKEQQIEWRQGEIIRVGINCLFVKISTRGRTCDQGCVLKHLNMYMYQSVHKTKVSNFQN